MYPLTSSTNGQIATWSHAGLIDLVAALAVVDVDPPAVDLEFVPRATVGDAGR